LRIGETVMQVATTIGEADLAQCYSCGAKLPWKPVEILRAA
jgi:hypothetical protein